MIRPAVSLDTAARALRVRPNTLRRWVCRGLITSRLDERGETFRVADLRSFPKPLTVFGGER
ncbi:hypothetical protein [Microbacterium sp. GXF6406]